MLSNYNYQTHKFRKVRGLFALLLLFVCTTVAHAASHDYGALEMDKAYSFDAFGVVSGHFTVPQNGVLKVQHSGGEFVRPYSDAEHLNEIDCDRNLDSKGRLVYELVVSQGQTIYFYNDFPMSSGTFTLSISSSEKKLELLGISPEPNSVFSIAGEPEIKFEFSSNVKIEQAELMCGTIVQNISSRIIGNIVYISPKADIYDLMKKGKIKAGQSITIRLNKVRMASVEDVLYGENGVCEASFICAEKPVELVKTDGLLKGGKSFLSFWMKGDPDGIIRAEFDGALQVPEADSKKQFVQLSYGNVEGETGSYYSEIVPYTVENGNVLVCDLTNKFRIPSVMTPSTPEAADDITIKLVGVRDAQGNYVYTEASGALGSITFTLPYKMITVDLISQFIPASGGSLNGVKNVELWITDYQKLSFDGVRFTYVENGVENEIITHDYQLTPDAEFAGACVMNIPVPAQIVGKRNVTVSLHKLLAADGNDYTEKLTAEYDSDNNRVNFETNPVNGSTVDAIDEIRLTFPDEMVVSLSANAGPLMLIPEGGTPIELPAATTAMDALNAIVIRTHNPVTTQGRYTLTIPDGYILDASWRPIPSIRLGYGIGVASGINQVVTTTGNSKVFSIDGRVMNGAKTNLPAGIYVIGGKKVVIR